MVVDAMLGEDWRPEHVVGWCARYQRISISISISVSISVSVSVSVETICRHLSAGAKHGETLHEHRRRTNTPFRKRSLRKTVVGGSQESARLQLDRLAARILCDCNGRARDDLTVTSVAAVSPGAERI